MVNPMVERATSRLLIGPDWAMNIEICDVCNRDPSQAKEVVRGIKKRLRSRNPKVQLLALMLLETIVKNGNDIVHMFVAEKDLPHEMVKIVRKKPDFHVKEKILILIDTWQEAFGGPRGRYPQYIVAFQDLLRLGVVFPQRPESSSLQPLASYKKNLRNPEARPDAAKSSAETEYPTLSLTELQNARGIMDILAEMLSALDPSNKEGTKQEVIVDLVQQCRVYKQRAVHLVNSTLDESLLCKGLALNDDLERVLAKHDSIASGVITVKSGNPKSEPAKPKPKPKPVVPVDAPLIDTGDSEQSEEAPKSSTTLALIATDGQSKTPTKADPKIDLLSGDDFNSPTANTLSIVHVGQPQPETPVASQQNALAVLDMFSENTNAVKQPSNPVGQTYLSSPRFQQQPNSPSPVYGAESSNAFPPPPWEEVLEEVQQMQPSPSTNESNQMTGFHPYSIHSQQLVPYNQPMQYTGGYMYPQQQMQMYENSYGYGYGYGHGQQQQNEQFFQHGVSGLSVRDGYGLKNSYSVPSGRPNKPEDRLFGDLVDIAKFKTGKMNPGRA